MRILGVMGYFDFTLDYEILFITLNFHPKQTKKAS